MPTKNANLLFYQGKVPAEPEGIFINDIHNNWYYDLHRLESDHNYIQWLFPTRESGRNIHAQALQAEEAAAIRNDSSLMRRFIRSYEMMLHFYGMRLLGRDSGEVTRGANWEEQFKNLNFSEHNFLRITRILKSLGELGLERYKAPLLRFLLTEAIEHRTLQNTLDSCHKYWIPTLRDAKERQDLIKHAESLAKARQSSKPKQNPEPRHSQPTEPSRPEIGTTAPVLAMSSLCPSDDPMDTTEKPVQTDWTTRRPGPVERGRINSDYSVMTNCRRTSSSNKILIQSLPIINNNTQSHITDKSGYSGSPKFSHRSASSSPMNNNNASRTHRTLSTNHCSKNSSSSSMNNTRVCNDRTYDHPNHSTIPPLCRRLRSGSSPGTTETSPTGSRAASNLPADVDPELWDPSSDEEEFDQVQKKSEKRAFLVGFYGQVSHSLCHLVKAWLGIYL